MDPKIGPQNWTPKRPQNDPKMTTNFGLKSGQLRPKFGVILGSNFGVQFWGPLLGSKLRLKLRLNKLKFKAKQTQS